MRYYFLTLILSLSLSVSASDELVVEQTTGETSWTISSIKDITFDGNGVKISFNDNSSVYYAKEALNMLKFNVSTSGINGLDASAENITVAGNIIIADGNEGEIKVFSLSGSIVAQGKGSKLDISNLNNGTYVVQAGSLISKIVKK